jgi:hypothetical protein
VLERSTYVLYVLPVLWIAAATVVALLLYRTSEALVEQNSGAQGGGRRVRLVGSVAIAVVVFVLLWRASPPLVPRSSDVVLTRVQEGQLNARRVAVVQTWARFQTCLDLPSVERCPEQQSDVDTAIRQLNTEYQSTFPTAKGD